MAGSRPEVREMVLERLKSVGVVKGRTFGAMREELGIPQDVVSNTQFSRAVRSLDYNYGVVKCGHEGSSGPHMQDKTRYIRLRQSTHV